MTAGVAVATVPLGLANAVAAQVPEDRRLIPAHKVGTITFTQRDVPGRLGIAASNAMGVAPTMGFLGGPDFPEDPTDLGPLVPLPGGWYELFEFLAKVGFEQIEFAGYGQNAGNPGGAAPNPAPGGVTTPESRAAYLAYGRTLRGFLDEFGLEAIGNHGFIPSTWPGPNSPGGAMSTNDYERYQTELEFAAILGMPFMGTGNDPTSANNRNIEAWTIAGEKWDALNEISLQSGIHLYPHNHSPAYNFLQDGPMVTVTEDRVTGAPIAADAGAGRVRQAPHAALPRRHRSAPLCRRDGHLLGPRRPAPAPVALRLRRQPRRGHLRSAGDGQEAAPALRAVARQGRRPYDGSARGGQWLHHGALR